MKKVEYLMSRSFAGEKTPAKASFLLTLKEDQQERNIKDIGFLLIYDIAGKQLKSFKLPSENKMLNIDAAELSAGIYYYTITINGNRKETNKLVIIK